MSNGNSIQANYEVELPSGGKMYLQSAEEVDLWENSHARYIEDYHLTKTNDLVLVGALLQQQVTLYRAQCSLNGMEAQLDNSGVPTGRYVQRKLDADETDKFIKMLNSASDQIQRVEKALGIDKVSREAGGAVTVENYLRTLKRAAHERGIHIATRVKKYEAFCMELKMKLRILKNADAEDRAYHDITPEKVLDWARDVLDALEEHDKKFAREKGALYVGKL
jgi:hypothetical protein